MSRTFGEREVLRNLSFALPRGGITALLGPNGAGKTTVVRILLGLLRPSSGQVRCFGLSPRSSVARGRVGVVFQKTGLPADLTVEELLSVFGAYHPAPVPPTALVRELELTELLGCRYGRLSGGQQRLVQFALAVIGRPGLLVLDEPTTGLDPDVRRRLWSCLVGLAERGATVLLTTHYLEEADRLADHVLVIHRGELVFDASPAELKAQAGTKSIRCRTKLDDERLRSLPGVVRIHREGAETRLDSLTAEESLRSLLKLDPTLADLTVSGGDLESSVAALASRRPEVRG